MSIRVFHTMVAPHVQQAARAFHEAGQLERFITSVYNDPASLHQRLLSRAGNIVGLDLEREFRRRAIHELPLELIESHPWAELFRVAIARLDRDRRLSDFIWEKAELQFDRMNARKLHKKLTGVYGFENSSLATFQRAKDLGLRVAYEMPAPHPLQMRRLLNEETSRFPQARTAYDDHLAARDDARMARRNAEWQLADVIVAASQFTKTSYECSGFDVSNVRVVPLGAPPVVEDAQARTGGTAEGEPLSLLWAGSFSIMKGAHYLLDAWRTGAFGRHARLRVYGRIALPNAMLQPIPEGVELCGSIPRAELMEQYAAGDALIFPTLSDGFGMVATEAWSRGLPVIATESAGAADLLRHGENGLLIRSRSSHTIAEAIEWCLSHRDELRAMRPAARETAARWQWADYRAALRKACSSLFTAPI